MSASVCYTISAPSPASHLYEIELLVTAPAEVQRFSLPAWIPGSYMIRDFARNIIRISATDDAGDCTMEQLDKQTWEVRGARGALRVAYQVYAWDLSVRGAHLDQTHAYFNGSSVFLRVAGFDHQALEVDIDAGNQFDDWRVTTSLPSKNVNARGFGRYQADDYADLIDHPVEIGIFDDLDFRVAGIPHRMVISGRHQGDLQRVRQDLAKICAEQVALFDALPVDEYLFMVQVTANDYGGLEHCDCTSLICPRDDLPPSGMEKPGPEYRRFLGLCSHEYFHLWNVKRIRPLALMESDLSAETYTELLWAFEGITSYYDDLGLLRSGCVDLDGYLDGLAQTITRVMRGSGRLKQSVANSSFNAWTRFYKQDENSQNAIVSYYAKGTLVAFGLDLLIRKHGGDGASLDTLMQLLWKEHGKPGIGVPERGLEALVAQICGIAATDYFASFVYGVEELPLQQWFDQLGIGYRLRSARSGSDKGGFVSVVEGEEPRLVLGIEYQLEGDYLRVQRVDDLGMAQLAGLAPGDRIVAIDGLQATPAMLDGGFQGHKDGDCVRVHAFRRDELMNFEVKLSKAPADTCELWLKGDAPRVQAELRQAWSASNLN